MIDAYITILSLISLTSITAIFVGIALKLLSAKSKK
jgi:hypothetical protein